MQKALHYLRTVPEKRRSTVTESAQSLPCIRTMLTECFLGAETSNPKPQCHSANRGFFKELFLLTERKQDQLKHKVEIKIYPKTKLLRLLASFFSEQINLTESP